MTLYYLAVPTVGGSHRRAATCIYAHCEAVYGVTLARGAGVVPDSSQVFVSRSFCFFLFPRRRTTTAGWAMDRGEDLDDIADRRGRNGVEQAGRGHRACG